MPVAQRSGMVIADRATVVSSVAVNCAGYGSKSSKVHVTIRHTARGNLELDLIAPNGTAYRLKSVATGDLSDNLVALFTVDLSKQLRKGVWTLRVRDGVTRDAGRLDSWTLMI
jgi:subtilisin-like proprotein convertase family protein